MMSLVAYEASSGEESDTDENEVEEKLAPDSIKSKTLNLPQPKLPNTKDTTSDDENTFTKNNIISDDEEYPLEINVKDDVETEHKGTGISFIKLPTPKPISQSKEIIEEVDDEFLHKKATPSIQVDKPAIPPVIKGAKVKITIPSLSEFKDLDKNDNKKTRTNIGPTPKTCGLLNLLPKPKQEQVYIKSSEGTSSGTSQNTSIKKSLIPDSVKNRQQVNKSSKILQNPMKPQVKKSLVTSFSDSEGSDNDEDFFSLNAKEELPAVNVNEINSMVAKKAAQMAENTTKYEKIFNKNDKNDTETAKEDVGHDNNENEAVQFDEKAIQMLVGSQAKRRKVEMNVVELSSEQVLPNKDEWLRTALAQATTYQPKGVLVDEEPVPGTRKKHQITYLAHQAKANEQELQAMWATNRHTRRQTQSKYGF